MESNIKAGIKVERLKVVKWTVLSVIKLMLRADASTTNTRIYKVDTCYKSVGDNKIFQQVFTAFAVVTGKGYDFTACAVEPYILWQMR